jgi:hypothetical protein
MKVYHVKKLPGGYMLSEGIEDDGAEILGVGPSPRSICELLKAHLEEDRERTAAVEREFQAGNLDRPAKVLRVEVDPSWADRELALDKQAAAEAARDDGDDDDDS